MKRARLVAARRCLPCSQDKLPYLVIATPFQQFNPRSFLKERERFRRSFNLQKLFYLPRLFRAGEKRLVAGALMLALISGGALLGRLYFKITKPAPGVGKSYQEGVVGAPHTINPIFATRDVDRDLSQVIFSGLVTYTHQGTIEPDLAERYEISDDGKIYTVFLRKNALWHDGKKLTAADVVFTVQTVQNPLVRSPLRANWQGVSVEQLDDYALRFSLRAPYAPFRENLTLGILPKHLWEHVDANQMLLHPLNIKPVGSGPYQFSQLRQEKNGAFVWYELARNTAYYRSGPYLKRITLVFFETTEAMVSAWRKGAIEGFGPAAGDVATEAAARKSFISLLQMSRVFGIFFNDKRAPALADQRVRAAIAHALDKTKIAAETSTQGVVPLDSPLPWLGNFSKTVAYPYDPARARTLLEQAGWKLDARTDAIRKKTVKEKGVQKTESLRFTLTTSDWPDLLRAAEQIKQMLRAAGIDIAIEKKPVAELESATLRSRNFDMLLFGQVYGYEPDPFPFWHSSQIKDPGLNIAHYQNAKVDQLLESARSIADSAARNEKYQAFAAILTHDLPAVFLFSQRYGYLLPKDMQGAQFEKIALPANRFNEITHWYRQTRRIFKWHADP